MKVLVTGGAGFIGTHVCRELLERGAEVVVFDDLSTGREANLGNLPVDLRRGCVTDAGAVKTAAAGADAVVHLAAVASVPLSLQMPARTHDVNVTGTLHVLEAARAVDAHVVLASSAAVYGDGCAGTTGESAPLAPVSPYATSKLAAEAYVTSWQRSFGMATLALRFFNVFGPLQRPGDAYAAVVPAFVDAALAGRPLQILGDGRQTRDFVPVSTVAALVGDAVLRRVSHPTPVNLALGSATSVLELVDHLEQVLRRPLPRSHRPSRAGDVHHSRGDNALLRRLFPDLAPTVLVDALRETVAWWQGGRAPRISRSAA
ncbi:NAD-dependent epimerase/dehydratase family protein [Dactylosporangium sp. NPDC051541]|uniref:NAD-dependent epimerase/dehydratase family protein n=1 Tax=Dactylosporangium sp. NPDC051541 TaxID=3363977 RepID=UPI0037976344